MSMLTQHIICDPVVIRVRLCHSSGSKPSTIFPVYPRHYPYLQGLLKSYPHFSPLSSIFTSFYPIFAHFTPAPPHFNPQPPYSNPTHQTYSRSGPLHSECRTLHPNDTHLSFVRYLLTCNILNETFPDNSI